jgi:hypothetical protein
MPTHSATPFRSALKRCVASMPSSPAAVPHLLQILHWPAVAKALRSLRAPRAVMHGFDIETAKEMGDGVGAATELRILRPGFAAGGGHRAHLFLRMHVLRGLRRNRAPQCVPELRRRFCAKANSAENRMAPRPLGGETATFDDARASVLWPCGDRGKYGADRDDPAGSALILSAGSETTISNAWRLGSESTATGLPLLRRRFRG